MSNRFILRYAESHDHTMHMGFQAGLAVPAEGAVGEVDVDAEAVYFINLDTGKVMELVDTKAVLMWVSCIYWDALKYQPET